MGFALLRARRVYRAPADRGGAAYDQRAMPDGFCSAARRLEQLRRARPKDSEARAVEHIKAGCV